MTDRHANDKPAERPIDRLRNAAISMKVGSAQDKSAISEMVAVDGRLHLVTEKAIYRIELADHIDPARSNPTIPNSQQQVLNIGAADPIVGKILLTGKVLFKKMYLGDTFDEKAALSLAWDITKDVATMAAIQEELRAHVQSITSAGQVPHAARDGLALPTTPRLEQWFHAYLQKLGHTVDMLAKMARLFFPDLPKKWVDALADLAIERYGSEHTFSQFMTAAGPALLFMRSLRNAVEHPKPDCHIKIFDFRLLANGEILVPSFELHMQDEDASATPMQPYMEHLNTNLLTAIEMLMAHLCNVTAKPFGKSHLVVFDRGLPKDHKGYVRMAYGLVWEKSITPLG